VDTKYSVALEIAAGARMQSVVVENDEDAARAIRYLKITGQARVTFLPLNKMETMSPLQRGKKEGFIDYAINLVNFDNKLAPAFWNVSGIRWSWRIWMQQGVSWEANGWSPLEGELLEKGAQ